MRSPWQIWSVFGVFLAVVLAGMAWLSARAIDLDRAEAAARQRAEDGQRELAKENRRVQIQQIETEREKLQTQLEKNIGQALWRMDSFMIPLLAQESFLPHSVYEPFQEVPVEYTPAQQIAENPTANASAPQPSVETSQPQARQQVRPSTLPATRWVPSPLLVDRSPYVKLHFQYDSSGKLTSPQAPSARYAAACVDNGIDPSQLTQSKEQLADFQKLNLYTQLAGNLPTENLPNQVPLQNLGYNLPPQRLVAQIDNSQPQIDSSAQTSSYYKPIDRKSRGSKNRGDFNYRNTAKEQYGQAEWARQQIASNLNDEIQQKVANTPELPDRQIREGVSEPKWIGDTLVLARRVEVKDAEYIQGLEFDWPQLRRDLLADVVDLLPEARLEPVHDVDESDEGRMLATLPVKLVVPPLPDAVDTDIAIEDDSWSPARAVSPIWATLGVAWSGVLLASLAVGGLLLGVVRLSERRAAFVSSVTHELRTPLTTFRMYAEMLAEDMITSPEQRQTYLNTLTAEADRLTHLVDNVLTYSRIERGRGVAKRQQTTLGDIVEQCCPRLAAHAAEAGMELVIESDDREAATRVATDTSVVEQILFNLIDNAGKYAQGSEDQRIHIRLDGGGRTPQIIIRDHGPGLSREAARKLFQPFSKSATEAAHSAPGVGLGLALSRRLARTLGGDLSWQAASDGGAQFTLSLAAGSR